MKVYNVREKIAKIILEPRENLTLKFKVFTLKVWKIL